MMDMETFLAKLAVLWAIIVVLFPEINVTAFICALLGGATLIAYRYNNLTRLQIAVYFPTSAIVGYAISTEMTVYFAFPYTNTMAFLCGALWLLVIEFLRSVLYRKQASGGCA